MNWRHSEKYSELNVGEVFRLKQAGEICSFRFSQGEAYNIKSNNYFSYKLIFFQVLNQTEYTQEHKSFSFYT